MDNLEKQQFAELLSGYLKESLTPAELKSFLEMASKSENTLLLQQAFEHDLNSGAEDLSSSEQVGKAWSKLNLKTVTATKSVRSRYNSLRWIAAAACLICVFGTIYFTKSYDRHPGTVKPDIDLQLPAWLTSDHVGATLILSGGDSILLDNQNKGLVAYQQNIQIFQQDGSISYSGSGSEQLYNEIRTGRGKLFRVTLPDQTVAWLNAGSSIRYPLQFSDGSRTVEITGEVYFDVQHKETNPFLVKSRNQIVEDIGTVFNINTSGDQVILTTLISGSVQVKASNKAVRLSPGQQAAVSGMNVIKLVEHANIDQALAWKNGFFYFQEADLHSVMDQLSDWYHVDVVYQGTESNQLFSGQIDKSLPLTQVLEGLQQPGVLFRLNGDRQIIIQQK